MTDDGDSYRALDPELLLWVWATLCDTALLVYERVRPKLSAAERAQYYEEWKLVAYACGVPDGDCPLEWDDFQSYVADVVERDLRVTPSARAVAHATMVPPLPWPLDRMTGGPQRLCTIGLLPPSVRDAFGFRWDRDRERQLRRLFRTVGTVGGAVPRPARELGMRYLVARPQPLDLPRLRRTGAKLTARRMATFERRAG